MVSKQAAERGTKIENSVGERFESLDIPGMSVAVVDGPETVYADGFGTRQLDPRKPATATTLYGIGSSVKPITATAVMRLVDEGILGLDDPVPSYVPYFDDAPGEPITIRELLSHTSGMPSDDMATVLLLEGGLDITVGPSLDSWDDFRAYVNESVDRRRLGDDQCLYYNSGYVVLSRVIEAVTDTPFAEYVQETVFDPLGMDTSTFDVTVLDDDSRNVMTPYFEDEDGIQTATLPDNPLFEAPGGLVTPVTDMATFLSAWITDDVPVESSLCETMSDPTGTFREFVDGTEVSYGHGWMIRPFGEDVLVGHGGGTGVSAGYLGFLQGRGLGVAIGCNAQPETNPERIAIELFASLTDRDPLTVLPESAIEQKAKRVTGTYESYHGIQEATVTWTGETLEIEHENPMGGDSVTLSPASTDPTEYVFQHTTGSGKKNTVEFVVEDDRVEFLLHRNLFEHIDALDEDRKPHA